MRDYTLPAYRQYLEALQSKRFQFHTFQEYFEGRFDDAQPWCLIRHDVDRKVENSLKMARLENDLGIRSTYYFRTKPAIFKPAIIKEIAEMGHEIGYHYENLSDTKGDMAKALEDFKFQLKRLREHVSVKTCAMHGRPLESFDNRDLWKEKDNHDLLTSELKILGEVYLDIDYSDILFITDSGRNWHSSKANLRDTVKSDQLRDFDSGDAMLAYFKSNPHPKMVFQIHPERWARSEADYLHQLSFDLGANFAKRLVKLVRS